MRTNGDNAECPDKGKAFRDVAREWFCLTRQERMWLYIIVGLVILGLSVRCRHLRSEPKGGDIDQSAVGR